jgi:2-polyprenyl-3-methyl-5-hydroxy-6-metoxy-1,4-benzoquinol methylase
MKAVDYYIQSLRFRMAGKFLQPKSKLLDIGCNQCEFFTYLKNQEIHGVGIDAQPEGKITNLPPNVSFIQAVFPSARLTGQRFDNITILAVLEHIPASHQKKFAEACHELLEKKGKVIITVPSPIVDYILHMLRFLRVIHGMSVEQHHGFKPGDTLPLFEQAGFNLVRHKTFEFGLNHLFVFEKS